MKIKLIVLYLGVILFSSCVTHNKLIYLNDDNLTKTTPKAFDNTKFLYRVQSNDVLHIQIKSSDSEITSMFNVISNSVGNLELSTLYINGYSVNEAGEVVIPTIGNVRVKNMTIEEATAAVQKVADNYLKNATVIVKIISFKITVLGEVKRPGHYYVFNGQANVLEGLGMAEDLTNFGKRENIKLIRQTSTGSEVILLDLTDPKLVSSKYYYLMPNDVLYVEPLKAQTKRTNLVPLGTVFSGLTTLVLILNYLYNVNK